MNELDNKIRDIFPEESIYKTPARYNMFAGVNLPYLNIKRMLGEELLPCQERIGTVVRRRWQEMFV